MKNLPRDREKGSETVRVERSAFFSLSKMTPMSSTYIDYLKYRYKKSNKFSKIRLIFTNFRKKWTALISLVDNFFLRQRCPPTSIYSSLISCGTHVLAWHMYLTGRDLILFLLSYFLFKMASVMNDFTSIKKLSPA